MPFNGAVFDVAVSTDSPLPFLKHRSGSSRSLSFRNATNCSQPNLGMKDEFAHRIPMHIVQFLLQFLLAPHIEVIEAALPESRSVRLSWSKEQSELRCRRFSRALSQSPGDSLLEHLQDFRGITSLGFTKEQMNMLRHDYITDELEVMPRADLVQNFRLRINKPPTARQSQRPHP